MFFPPLWMSRCATIIWFPLISDSTHFQYVFGKNQRYHHCQLLHISAKNIEKHVGRPTRLWKISKKNDHVVFSVSVAPVGTLESNKNLLKPCHAQHHQAIHLAVCHISCGRFLLIRISNDLITRSCRLGV